MAAAGSMGDQFTNFLSEPQQRAGDIRSKLLRLTPPTPEASQHFMLEVSHLIQLLNTANEICDKLTAAQRRPQSSSLSSPSLAVSSLKV